MPEDAIKEMIKQVLIAKPENPRRFLLRYLEEDWEIWKLFSMRGHFCGLFLHSHSALPACMYINDVYASAYAHVCLHVEARANE